MRPIHDGSCFSEPFKEGVNANLRNQSQSTNPYREGVAWNDWLAGWRAAREIVYVTERMQALQTRSKQVMTFEFLVYGAFSVLFLCFLVGIVVATAKLHGWLELPGWL